ncbi:hypothetical protein [Bacillus sp. FJAT-45350]|uniref:hypothetical protein n=1 Tax=Bacillus sp. FJAT-45350 TaxID=2011014 RepID=UPI000BB8053B|nr:hypothetical protein [Bacillus sp. FJAT-45350]
MLIFRKVARAVKEVQGNLNDQNLYNEDERQLEQKKLDALMLIVDFINKQEYLSHQKSKERLKYFLKNKLDYEKARLHFNTSKNSIEASVSYIGKKLEKLIGLDTIDMILEGRIDEALTQFHIGTGKVKTSDWFIEGVHNYLPEPKKDILLSFEDCQEEITLLGMFSHFYLEDLFKLYNADKLSHLLYVLNSTDAKIADEREILCRLINGDFSRKNADADVLKMSVQVKKAIKELQSKNPFDDPKLQKG